MASRELLQIFCIRTLRRIAGVIRVYRGGGAVALERARMKASA